MTRRLFKYELVSVWGQYLHYDEALTIVLGVTKQSRSCAFVREALR